MQDFDDFLRKYETDVCAEFLSDAQKGLDAYRKKDWVVFIVIAAAIIFAVRSAFVEETSLTGLYFGLAVVCSALLIVFAVFAEKNRCAAEGRDSRNFYQIIQTDNGRISSLEQLLVEFGFDFGNLGEMNALIQLCEKEKSERDLFGSIVAECRRVFEAIVLPVLLFFGGVILTKLGIDQMNLMEILRITGLSTIAVLLIYGILKISYPMIHERVFEDEMLFEFLIYDLRHVHCFFGRHEEMSFSE